MASIVLGIKEQISTSYNVYTLWQIENWTVWFVMCPVESDKYALLKYSSLPKIFKSNYFV